MDCACVASKRISAVARAENRGVPFQQFAGDEKSEMGRGHDSGEDEGMRVGPTGTRCADRFPRMD